MSIIVGKTVNGGNVSFDSENGLFSVPQINSNSIVSSNTLAGAIDGAGYKPAFLTNGELICVQK